MAYDRPAALTQRPPPLVLALLACDLLLALTYVLNSAAGRPWSLLTRLVDLDGEGNVPAWFSSMQWMLCACAFALFSARNFSRAVPRSWALMLLPALLVLLSLDEVAQIHEALGRRSDGLLEGDTRSNSTFRVTGIWMFVIGVPFIASVLALGAWLSPYMAAAPAAAKRIGLGMMMMLAGALGVETLSNFVVPHSAWAVAEIAAEEFLEMLGATLVLWGALDLLATHGLEIRFVQRAVTPGEGDRRK
jgi:hypothetical protein